MGHQAHWVCFEIHYHHSSRRKENSAVDALSRKMLFTALSVWNPKEIEKWEFEVQQDRKLQTIKQCLAEDSDSKSGL